MSRSVAIGRNFLNDTLEGRILIRIGGQRAPLNLDKQLRKGWIGGEICPENQRIDEEADQRLQFLSLTPCDGRTDCNVVTGARAVQKRLPCRQERHKQGGSVV